MVPEAIENLPPSDSQQTLTVSAFAKINLSLKILGVRKDGFHELDTVFQTVDLADRLSISTRESPEIRLSVKGDVSDLPPADESNLVWRAARLFLDDLWSSGKRPGLSILLEKRIPVGAGLGGGSSDAAAVLTCLSRLFKREVPKSELEALARDLGSDVPFFLTGGTARGTGRGDHIVGLDPIDSTELVLVVPPVLVSTARVFAQYAQVTTGLGRSVSAGAKNGSADRSISSKKLDEWVTGNDLEETVFRLYPDVAAVYTACQESHAVSVQLTGSGGCVFARFPSSDFRRHAPERWSRLPSGCRVYEVRTLNREQVKRERLST